MPAVGNSSPGGVRVVGANDGYEVFKYGFFKVTTTNKAFAKGVPLGDEARVVLTMPAQPRFLRLARLAVADAGTRAGFTVEDVEDLRLAIDELCGPMMVGHGEIVLTLFSSDGCVEIQGNGSEPSEPPAYPDIAEAIIEAVVDDHCIATANGTRTFSATKRTTPV